MTICAEILSLSDEENCGIANNWLPVVAKALIPLEHVRNQNGIITMSNRSLPKSMQTCSIMEMLLCSIDPKHDMNADQETLVQLQQMLSDEQSNICSLLDRIIVNSTFSARAKEVRSNISDLLDGNLGKRRPRGKAKRNCVWNETIGMWVEERQVLRCQPLLPRELMWMHLNLWLNHNLLHQNRDVKLDAFTMLNHKDT